MSQSVIVHFLNVFTIYYTTRNESKHGTKLLSLPDIDQSAEFFH